MRRSTKVKRSAQLVVKVEPALSEQLEAAANQDRRPKSSLIRNILADAMAARNAQEAGAHAA
jgi:predicted transcriptional regulator